MGLLSERKKTEGEKRAHVYFPIQGTQTLGSSIMTNFVPLPFIVENKTIGVPIEDRDPGEKNGRRPNSQRAVQSDHSMNLGHFFLRSFLPSEVYPLVSSKNAKILLQSDRSLQNYYACISQIASWGSDHGSWILFLKYIRTNIYKGDLLLSNEIKRTNFQLLPRTGSILLEQLLITISNTFILGRV